MTKGQDVLLDDDRASGAIYSLIDESRLLLRLYSEIGTSNFWQGFVQELAPFAKIDAAVLALSRTDRWEVLGVWTWKIDMEAMGRYMTEEMAGQDELMAHVNVSPPGHFYSAGISLASMIQENSRYGAVYNNWIAPMGFSDVAIAMVPSEHTAAAIGIYRKAPKPDFTQAELDHYDRLLPHMARALRLHSELVQQQNKLDDLQGWLSLIKVPVLLFDGNFQCREKNAAARALLASQDEICVNKGFLEFKDPAATSQVTYQIVRTVKAAIGSAEGPPPTSRLTNLTVMVKGEPVNLFFMPVDDAGDSNVTSAGALVFIHQQSVMLDLDFSPLQAAFALTDAELLLTTRLAQGLSLAEIAEQEGKSRETVRSQLKSVFAKTGAQSQAELVVSLLTHPSVVGAI